MGMDSVAVGVAWRSNVWNGSLTVSGFVTVQGLTSNTYVDASPVYGFRIATVGSIKSGGANGKFLLSDNAGTDFNLLQFGGTTNAFPALKRSGTDFYVRLADDSGYASIYAGGIFANVSSSLGWASRTKMQSASDGSATLYNWAGTDFNLLQFGGTTSSFPALKKNGSNLQVRQADDSGDTFIISRGIITTGGAASPGATGFTIGGITATTVGAAGGASALPATPLGYIVCYAGPTQVKIPYYNA